MNSYSCFSVFAFIICTNHAFSKPDSDDSYAKHCSSVIPPSNITTRGDGSSLPSLSTSYFTGGDRFHQRLVRGRPYYYVQKHLSLRILSNCLKTTAAGVYDVEGVLCIRFPYSIVDAPANHSYNGDWNRRRGSLRFPMKGLWSERSRMLCMVGSTSWMGIDNIDSVLKLKFDDLDPTIHTGVVSGSLESTASADSPAHFDPFLIFSFPPLPISSYSLVWEEDEVEGGFPSRRDESLSLNSTEFCSVIDWGLRLLKLEYATECRRRQPAHNCSPLDFLPYYLLLAPIQCLEGAKKARFVATFLKFKNGELLLGYDGFAVGSSMVGEAWWDEKKRRIIGAACEISNPSLQLGNAVGDCSTRFSLLFPSVLTIRNDVRNFGEIWSSKGAEDSGYFRKINFTIADENGAVVPKPRYEYTQVDRARKSCSKKKAWKKKRRNMYPDAHSNEMIFNIIIRKGNFGKDLASAFVAPVWVDHDVYRRDTHTISASESEHRIRKMSYKITIYSYLQVISSSNISSPSLDWAAMSPSGELEISAEGVYDAGNGHLCLVGCRDVHVQNSTSAFKDCELALEFELTMVTGERGGLITGAIRSTRPKTDALHFDDLVTEFVPFYREDTERSIRRMDMEIVMVLISSTFSCIFVALQIFHVKKNPEVSSSASVVMVVILTAGSLIPLVLNFEATFLGDRDEKTVQLGSGGKLEANETVVRLITLVLLFLQLRLLHLVYTAKHSENNGKKSWSEEKKVGFVSISLYILGCLCTLLLNWIRRKCGGRRCSVWGDLRSYGGLILDSYLLPQIMLNVLRGSAGEVLCRSFYIGTSVVRMRLVPDAYNMYNAHNYPKHEAKAKYYNTNPAAEDFVVPCVVMALAAIVFVQQLNGGRCILPRRLMALEMYEKVPAADDQ